MGAELGGREDEVDRERVAPAERVEAERRLAEPPRDGRFAEEDGVLSGRREDARPRLAFGEVEELGDLLVGEGPLSRRPCV